MTTEASWHVGQDVVINRSKVAIIERILPSGRVVVDGRTFNVDGRERSAAFYYDRALLEPLTSEIREEMALEKNGRVISSALFKELERVDQWARRSFVSWGRIIPAHEDVERAKKFVSALRALETD